MPISSLPLSVWPCSQQSGPRQRAGRYARESSEHPAKMLPDLARRIITTYTEPGQLVIDPMCGIGTTLVEAAAAGRRCIGVDLEPRWARLARRNIQHAHPGMSTSRASVRMGDARRLTDVLADVAGKVDLVLVSPPYGCHVGNPHDHRTRRSTDLCDTETENYGPDRSNLGHARGKAYGDAMRDVYAGCAGILRPGGYLVTVTKNSRPNGGYLHLASLTISLVEQVGLALTDHVIALLCAVRGDDLVPWPSFWQTVQTRRRLAAGVPAHLPVTEDVLVFQHRRGRRR